MAGPVIDFLQTIIDSPINHVIGGIAATYGIVSGIYQWVKHQHNRRHAIVERKTLNRHAVILTFSLSDRTPSIDPDVLQDITEVPDLSFLKEYVLDAPPLSKPGSLNFTQGPFKVIYDDQRCPFISVVKAEEGELPLNTSEEAQKTYAHFKNAMDKLHAGLKENGIKDIHMFYAGPVGCFPVYIGEMAKNNYMLYTYHRCRKNGHYVMADKIEPSCMVENAQHNS